MQNLNIYNEAIKLEKASHIGQREVIVAWFGKQGGNTINPGWETKGGNSPAPAACIAAMSSLETRILYY